MFENAGSLWLSQDRPLCVRALHDGACSADTLAVGGIEADLCSGSAPVAPTHTESVC